MIRTALFGLATAAGLSLAAGDAKAQVYIAPRYNPYGYGVVNPYGVVTSNYYTAPGLSVVTPLGGITYSTSPVYSTWSSGFRPYSGTYYRSYYPGWYGGRYYRGYWHR